MRYANFGGSGMIVSRLCLGTMTFGQGRLIGDLHTNLDQKAVDRMVSSSLDAGINFFDTADMYTSGQAEEMLGKALKGKRQDNVVVTKCAFRSGDAIVRRGLSYRYIMQSVSESLRRLDTDYIDVLMLHIPDPFTPLEETARALIDIVDKGWVRYVGTSNFPSWMAQKLAMLVNHDGSRRYIGTQMYYSLLGRTLEHDFLPFLDHNDFGLMVWSPLAGGFLSGKYTKDEPVPDDARRKKFDFPAIDVEQGYRVVEALQDIAEKHKTSVAATALAWLLAEPVATSVIIGASKMSQLEDNLSAATIELSDEDVEALDEVSDIPTPYPAWMQPMAWDDVIVKALGFDR